MTTPNFQAMHTAHISLSLRVTMELKIQGAGIFSRTPCTHEGGKESQIIEQPHAPQASDTTLDCCDSAPAMILPPMEMPDGNGPHRQIDHSERAYRDLILVLLEQLQVAGQAGDVSKAALLNWQIQMMRGKVKPMWWGVVVQPRARAIWDALEPLVD